MDPPNELVSAGPLVFFLVAPGTGSVKRLEAVLIVIDTKSLVSTPPRSQTD